MKLEYVKEGSQRIILWETKNNATLETSFNSDGYILMQKVVDLETTPLDKRVMESLREANISQTKQAQFSDVKINKPCPKCGEGDLSRYVEAFASKKEIPVMPLYYCAKCTTKSYLLTNEYLEYLVDTNKSMFSEEELSELAMTKVSLRPNSKPI